MNSPSRRPLTLGKAFGFGLVAGLVGTGMKTLCEVISPPRPPGVESPLGNAINAVSRGLTGHPLQDSLKSVAEPVVHFGFGAVAAAIYVIISERFPLLRTGCGALFGFLFWLGLHEIALPLMGFSPSPAQMSLWEQGNELVSHIIFGVAVELVRRGLSRKFA